MVGLMAVERVPQAPHLSRRNSVETRGLAGRTFGSPPILASQAPPSKTAQQPRSEHSKHEPVGDIPDSSLSNVA